jgi:CheY-like chemotaxis protein/HPt (histidine-containing phosphotransfer) domain-containing protein
MTSLLLDTDLTEEQRHYAETVRSSGEALLSLINDILDLSKLEAGKVDLETLEFDLPALLDDLAATLAVRAEEKGLELLCEADLDVPLLVRGDPGRLRQILGNLLGNAIKFTAAGEVSVRASLQAQDEEGVLVRFSVRDTGIGIPAEKKIRLFQKFSQVDASTTRHYGGTGLGLAISKQLAEQMGGAIGVESREGAGSEFWFTARLARAPRGASADPARPAGLDGVRALVVDDNGTSRDFLLRRLTHWGLRAAGARGGEEALRALHEALAEGDPFRLALLDLRMPGMDGEALGRAIRADERLEATRLILQSLLGRRGDAQRLEELGFAGWLTKPVRPPELQIVLAQVHAGLQRSPTQRLLAARHGAHETAGAFADRAARILVAEDNPTNQEVVVGMLRRLGLRADAVANGAEAVQALEAVPYRLVLMDVQMPEMDGFEATARIRSADSRVHDRRVPIVAMTAHALRGDRERCLEAGMDDYVSKPVSVPALTEALSRWLPQAPGQRQETSTPTSTPTPTPTPMPTPTPTAPPDGPPIFDRAGMLERMAGDEELVALVLETFRSDTPQQLAVLLRCATSGDLDGARRQAHSIKGASSNVGGEAVRSAAFEVEKAGRAGDLPGLRRLLPELEAQVARLDGELAAYLARGR